MAILGLKDGVIYYKNGDKFIATSVSHKLTRVVQIKEHHMGYFVIDIEYDDGRIVEDYLDLGNSLLELGLSSEKKDYFRGVKAKEICVKNH